ncbi:glycosyltransferase [Paenibacillus lutimineralis]|uniref:Glycosyltransferase family 2 protein n=1 Tax=Paenibacillus lutimineralis TaxID=2707005 RepID=A0A3Q9IBN3_9BACL|nr:glycosyltransferase family 2 protein [Paenibacillus lutimineralis]AZS15488.1 glycosyltransferase family 2 protein [Paenibacillus lutimineralis]
MNLTILIPIKTSSLQNCEEFSEYIDNLAYQLKDENCEFVIANESPYRIFEFMNSVFEKNNNIIHFAPEDSKRTGDNDKLNGIYCGLEKASYDNVLLIDDHFRVTKDTLRKCLRYFEKYDCFKMMPLFNKFPFSVLIDLNGMFVVNMLDYRKQYCGHLAFKKSQYKKVGFPNRNGLFDELTMEEHLRDHGYSVGFIRDVALEAIQDIKFSKFLEQRVRYAYENIAFPIRFTFFAMILPILLILFILSPAIFSATFIYINLAILLVSFIGQILYARNFVPPYTFLLSPIWFWFYPFTTWIAVYKYFTGGVMFGGNKIKRAK